MVKKTVLALLVAGLLFAPAATAQVGDAFSIGVADASGEVAYDGTKDVEFTVTVGCGIIIQGGSSSLDVDVSTDLPAYYGVSTKTVTLTADQGCLNPSGSVSVTDKFTLTPTADAWGLNKTTFTLTATDGTNTDTATHSGDVWVSYKSGHVVTPSVTFPYEFTKDDEGVLNFTVTVEVTGNSDTMVMFLEPSTEGTLGGLTHQIVNIKSNGDDRTRTLNVTWKPPAGSWDNATINFRQVSHCLDTGFDCPFMNEQNTTWVIQNKAGNGGGGGDGGDKESPGAAPVSLAIALVAVALLAARRR